MVFGQLRGGFAPGGALFAKAPQGHRTETIRWIALLLASRSRTRPADSSLSERRVEPVPRTLFGPTSQVGPRRSPRPFVLGTLPAPIPSSRHGAPSVTRKTTRRFFARIDGVMFGAKGLS